MKNHSAELFLAICVMFLLAIGELMVFSASYPQAIKDAEKNKNKMIASLEKKYGDGQISEEDYNKELKKISDRSIDGLAYVKKQTMFIVIGIVVMLAAMNFPVRGIKNLSLIIFIITVAMCLAVHTKIGVEANGAKRWLDMKFALIQPSDFLKLGIAIFMPRLLLSRENRNVVRIKALIMIAVCCAVVYVQKDLGTTIVIAAVMGILYYVTRMKMYEMPFYIGAAAIFMIKSITSEGYRMSRFNAFFDPHAYRDGAGWGILQSMYAVAHGGLFGVGIGNSVQKYYYIYAAHSDYIFAILTEELGVFGAAFVIGAYVYVVYSMIKYSTVMEDQYYSLFLLAFAGFLAIQSLVHIGVVVNAIPAKGLTLPFISYGGSSIITYLAFTGIAFNMIRNGKRKA